MGTARSDKQQEDRQEMDGHKQEVYYFQKAFRRVPVLKIQFSEKVTNSPLTFYQRA
jgi:hypothetical protein